MPHLSLGLLGAFEATLDGKPIAGFATNKVRALLIYLAVESERPHPRESLIGLLWGELPNQAAFGNLRYALSNLRRAIGDRLADPPFLLIARHTIQFNPISDYELDVNAWLSAYSRWQMAKGQPLPTSHMLSAVRNYRGRFLEGFTCDSAQFEEWVLLKREQIGLKVLDTLHSLTAHYVERGEYVQVQTHARKVIELEPWDEEAHRHLMRALACVGQRSAALAQYEACCHVLKQELGIEPSRETTVLYERIRDGEFDRVAQEHQDATKTLPPNVPIPLTSFIGRQNELSAIKRLLKTTRLLTLAGAGGCGKTRLAIQLATDVAQANDFEYGVWWVALAALSEPTLVTQTVASVLGLRESPDMPIVKRLVDFVRSRELLLVLDNCEHLRDACAKLTETLLSACPHLQIMVTSREPLGINGEMTWRVPSLALPDAAQMPPDEELGQYDALRLFAARAAMIEPEWDFATNAQVVAEICARLDGIPLAIELAAARLKLLSAAQIAARLDDRFNLLTGGSPTALPRHQTLRATMDWSYELLPDAERVLLRQLSVFAGGLTLEAAEAVATQPEVLPYRVLDLLTSLTDKSLVVMERKNKATRYRLLETVRQYAFEKSTAEEAQGARNRHLEFFVQMAEEAQPQLRRPEQTIWLGRLELEHGNLRAALEWARGGGSKVAGLRLAGALAEFWRLHGHLTEGSQWLARMLAGAPCAPEPVRAKALLEFGSLVLRQGAISEASRMGDESLALYRELGDQDGIAHALVLSGSAAHFLGNDEQAKLLLQESLPLFEQVGDRSGYAYAQLWMARGEMRRGEHARAAALLEVSLGVFREVGDKDNLSFALGSLGDLARHQGDYARAASLRKESLRLAWEAGSPVEVSFALEQLAMIAMAQREPERAVTLWGATEALRESTSRPMVRTYQAEYDPAVAEARTLLEEDRFASAWAEGRAMTIEQAVRYALGEVQSDSVGGRSESG